jgi:carbonic anhydrase
LQRSALAARMANVPHELLKDCVAANRRWVERVRAADPRYFERLSSKQRPELLWIGCADSRLPPDSLIGREPGEVFVHRNVANVVVHTDMNCLSVIEFAVNVLEIRHIVVVGHYGCGGVTAAYRAEPRGLVENWLRHVRDVCRLHRTELDAIADESRRIDRLAELNVEAQVANVCHTTVVRDAWRRGQPIAVQGWIFSLADGLLRDLLCVRSVEEIPDAYAFL